MYFNVFDIYWNTKWIDTLCRQLTGYLDTLMLKRSETVLKKMSFHNLIQPTSEKEIYFVPSTYFVKLNKKIWDRKDIIMAWLYYAQIISIRIYTCETWKLWKEDIQRFSVFVNNFLRVTTRGKYQKPNQNGCHKVKDRCEGWYNYSEIC